MSRPERPKKPDNLTMGDFFYEETRYREDLENYCDELEKALDKACEDIATYVIKDVDKGEIVYMQLHILKEKYKSEYLSESEKE